VTRVCLKTLTKGGASVSLTHPSSSTLSPSLFFLLFIKKTAGKSVYSYSLSLLLSLLPPLLEGSILRKYIEEAYRGKEAHRGKESRSRIVTVVMKQGSTN
jgi:hypothetical protein